MPFWYFVVFTLSIVECYLLRTAEPNIDHVLDASTGLFGLSIIFTLAALVPINNRIACLRPANPLANWLALRKRWDRLHRVRVMILFIALFLLASGEMIRSRQVPDTFLVRHPSTSDALHQPRGYSTEANAMFGWFIHRESRKPDGSSGNASPLSRRLHRAQRHAVQTKTGRPGQRRFAHAAWLARCLGLDMKKWFTSTAGNYFWKIARTGILAAVNRLSDLLRTSRILDPAHNRGRSPSPKNSSPVDVRAPQGPRVSWRPWRSAPCLFPPPTDAQSPFGGIRPSQRVDRCSRASRPIHRSPSQRSGCRLLRPGAPPPVHGSSESIPRLNR
jgi:Domain of unknown function (DUF1772)